MKTLCSILGIGLICLSLNACKKDSKPNYFINITVDGADATTYSNVTAEAPAQLNMLTIAANDGQGFSMDMDVRYYTGGKGYFNIETSPASPYTPYAQANFSNKDNAGTATTGYIDINNIDANSMSGTLDLYTTGGHVQGSFMCPLPTN